MFVCCCWSRRRQLQICLTSSPSPDTSTSPASCLVASTARPTPTRSSRTSTGRRTTGPSSSTEGRAPPATDAWQYQGTARWCSDRRLLRTPDCIPARRPHGLAKDNRQLHETFMSKVSAIFSNHVILLLLLKRLNVKLVFHDSMINNRSARGTANLTRSRIQIIQKHICKAPYYVTGESEAHKISIYYLAYCM